MKISKGIRISITAVFILGICMAAYIIFGTAKYKELPSGAFAKQFAPYSRYGLEYIGTEYNEEVPGSGRGNLYYNGNLVERFIDNVNGHDIFNYEAKEANGINIHAVYNDNGELIGVEEY